MSVITYNFEYDREDHKYPHEYQKRIKLAIIFRSDAIGNPRTVMVVYTYTSLANLAMP